MTETQDPQKIAYTIMASMGALSVPSLSVETAIKIQGLLTELQALEMSPELARKYGKDLSGSGLVERLRATRHPDPGLVAMLILEELQRR